MIYAPLKEKRLTLQYYPSQKRGLLKKVVHSAGRHFA